ncbi:hypothetical protein ABBQ38_006970 [Trebouxia sp. C0009 RCD-2024]
MRRTTVYIPPYRHAQAAQKKAMASPKQAMLAQDGTLQGQDPILHIGKTQFQNADFPMDEQGRTYHLGTKRGEVANKILSVGSTKRAMLLSQLLDHSDNEAHLFEIESDRGFLTITGRFKGSPVSIVSTMMGMANMDFVIRECLAVVEGPLAMVRLGTCGAIQPPAHLGNFLVASQGSACVRRDPDAFVPGSTLTPYLFSQAILPDAALSSLLQQHCAAALGEDKALHAFNVTADSFYSSQGRPSTHFDDRNDDLLASLARTYPNALSLEMETFHLFDLARCSGGRIRAAAVAIVLAERYTNDFIAASEVEKLEGLAGLAALTSLHQYELGLGIQNEQTLTV